jgi:hypothetical protein
MPPDDTNRSERCIGNFARSSGDLSSPTDHTCHTTKTKHNLAPAVFRRTLQSAIPGLDRRASDKTLSRTFYRIGSSGRVRTMPFDLICRGSLKLLTAFLLKRPTLGDDWCGPKACNNTVGYVRQLVFT